MLLRCVDEQHRHDELELWCKNRDEMDGVILLTGGIMLLATFGFLTSKVTTKDSATVRHDETIENVNFETF